MSFAMLYPVDVHHMNAGLAHTKISTYMVS